MLNIFDKVLKVFGRIKYINYLELYVKTIKKWRDKDQFLNQTLGYKDFNN